MEDYLVLLKALELACEWISNDHNGSAEDFMGYFIKQAKEKIA
jgi:hypothetical protein